MQNLLTNLKKQLLNAFSAEGFNNSCHAQVLNHQVIESNDESKMGTLIISFSDYSNPHIEDAQVKAAEHLTKIAIDNLHWAFDKELDDFDCRRIERTPNGPLTLITGYAGKNAPTIWATVLNTDNTLYITIQDYPQY